MLVEITGPMLAAREALRIQFNALHRRMLAVEREGAVCRRLMTVPGVGPQVALTFRSAVDTPERFAKFKTVGALFGLTPKKQQSDETDIAGSISRVGNAMVHAALYEATNMMLCHSVRFSSLRR